MSGVSLLTRGVIAPGIGIGTTEKIVLAVDTLIAVDNVISDIDIDIDNIDIDIDIDNRNIDIDIDAEDIDTLLDVNIIDINIDVE